MANTCHPPGGSQAASTPMAREPAALTAKVPTGNPPRSGSDTTAAETAYLNALPAKPPAPASNISFTIIYPGETALITQVQM